MGEVEEKEKHKIMVLAFEKGAICKTCGSNLITVHGFIVSMLKKECVLIYTCSEGHKGKNIFPVEDWGGK